MLAETYTRTRERIFRAIWEELDPLGPDIERHGRLPYDIMLPILRRVGALGCLIPEEYGGLGMSIQQYLPVIAEFAKTHGAIRVFVHVHNSMAHALDTLGSSEQRSTVLPAVVEGRGSVAFALTEPGAGTGADIRTKAEPHGESWLINGSKHLITNSDMASHFIVFAKTGEGRDDESVSAFLVERGIPGFTIESLPETMGCKGGEHGRLTFENCAVPAQAIMGIQGAGLTGMEECLEISRLFIAASSLGTSERALELSLEYAKQRVTFGKPISHRQAIQRYIAEMATDIYALRGMLSRAAEKWDRGKRIPSEAAMCKLFGLEAVGRVTDRALLIHGGIGYTQACIVERLYRDARLNWIEEGTPTIQHMVIAKEFLRSEETSKGAFGWER